MRQVYETVEAVKVTADRGDGRLPDGRWVPGIAVSGPGPGRPKDSDARREALAILKAATPETAKRLIALQDCPDERVALAAIKIHLDITIGAIRGPALATDQQPSILASMSAVQLLDLLAAAKKIAGH